MIMRGQDKRRRCMPRHFTPADALAVGFKYALVGPKGNIISVHHSRSGVEHGIAHIKYARKLGIKDIPLKELCK